MKLAFDYRRFHLAFSIRGTMPRYFLVLVYYSFEYVSSWNLAAFSALLEIFLAAMASDWRCIASGFLRRYSLHFRPTSAKSSGDRSRNPLVYAWTWRPLSAGRGSSFDLYFLTVSAQLGIRIQRQLSQAAGS